VINLASLLQKPLADSFRISEIDLTHKALEDALGRQAIAQTRIVGREFWLSIRAGLPEE
jgi:hypothetical protein